MAYRCNLCGVSFTFRNNLYRHRKNSCKNQIETRNSPINTSGNQSCLDEKRSHVNEKQSPMIEIETRKHEPPSSKLEIRSSTCKVNTHTGETCSFRKTSDNRWQCTTCDKIIAKQNKTKHSKTACFRHKYGQHICMFCERVYDKVNTRQKHETTCKARQTSLEVATTTPNNNTTTVNNTTINHNSTVINIIQNNHNNIVLNPFGQEDWDGLWELCGRHGRKDFETLKTQLVTQGMDGISKLIEHHYFNKDYPNNHTIRKPVKNNDFVEVHVGNNEWEHKTLATAMENIKESTTMYLCPMIEEVLNDSYEQDKQIQNYVNRLFTNVLVPMNYDICEKYKDRLRDVEPVGSHVSEQHGQIVMRNMKTVLHQLSLKLKSLSDNIDVR